MSVNSEQTAALLTANRLSAQLVTVAAGTTPLLVTTKPDTRLAAQKFFVGSTGRITLAAAGNLRATFRNTSTTKNVVIMRAVAVSSAAAMAWATIYLGPTAGLAAGVVAPFNAYILAADNNNTTVVEMRADTSLTTALSGGTKKLDLAVPQGARTVYDIKLIVEPLVLLGLNLVFAGAADGELTIYYYEED